MPKTMTSDEFLFQKRKLLNIGEPLFLHRIEIEETAKWVDAILADITRRSEIKNRDLTLAVYTELKTELINASAEITRILDVNKIWRSGITDDGTVARSVEKRGTPKVSFTRNSVQTRLEQVGANGGFAPLVLSILAEFKVTQKHFGLTPIEIKALMLPRAGIQCGKVDQKSLACLTRLTENDLVRANGRAADGEYLYIASPLGRYIVAN